jgi:hypothetical protein
LVLVFQHGRSEAEHMGVNGIYSKLGKGNTKGGMVRPRWKSEAKRAYFCSSGAFKTYDNLWEEVKKEIPSQ